MLVCVFMALIPARLNVPGPLIRCICDAPLGDKVCVRKREGILGHYNMQLAGVEGRPDTEAAVAVHATHACRRHHERPELLSIRGETPPFVLNSPESDT